MSDILRVQPKDLNREVIERAKQSLDLLYIPNLIPVTATWQDFINHTSFMFNSSDYAIPTSPVKIVNGLEIRNNFYVIGNNADAENLIPQAQEANTQLEGIYGRLPNGSCTLINFVIGEEPIVVHKDIKHGFFWQCIGVVEWRLHEGNDYKSVTVNPGDVIFTPQGAVHGVIPKTPRASISFAYHREEGEIER